MSQVAKTFSQLKVEEAARGDQQQQDKLARLESHAILEEIQTHLDHQVSPGQPHSTAEVCF